MSAWSLEYLDLCAVPSVFGDESQWPGVLASFLGTYDTPEFWKSWWEGYDMASVAWLPAYEKGDIDAIDR